MRKIFFALMMIVVASNSYAAGYVSDVVREVSVRYGNGCILLENGEFLKVDLETAAGRAEMTLAITAKTAGKRLSVYQTDAALESGCGSSTTVKPHSVLRLID